MDLDVLIYLDIDQGIHCNKSKVAQNEKRKKNYLGFHIPKIWQILKYLFGAFRQTQTLELLGVVEPQFILK